MSFTASETGGEYNHVLTESEMPRHDHPENLMAKGDGGWNEFVTDSYGAMIDRSSNEFLSPKVKTNAAIVTAFCSTSSTGNNASHNNVQPFITTFFWKRTN